MTIRVLACWALCAALVSADDKPKAGDVKKPANAEEAVAAMAKAKTAKPKTREDMIAIQDKIVKAADAVLGFKDASDEQKDKALVAKATALSMKAMYKPDSAKEFDEFAATVEKDQDRGWLVGFRFP